MSTNTADELIAVGSYVLHSESLVYHFLPTVFLPNPAPRLFEYGLVNCVSSDDEPVGFQAGNVQGKVEEVGIHSTRLLNNDKCPIIVPNSFFSSEVCSDCLFRGIHFYLREKYCSNC